MKIHTPQGGLSEVDRCRCYTRTVELNIGRYVRGETWSAVTVQRSRKGTKHIVAPDNLQVHHHPYQALVRKYRKSEKVWGGGAADGDAGSEGLALVACQGGLPRPLTRDANPPCNFKRGEEVAS